MAAIPTSQSLERNSQVIQELIPPGSRVITDDYWWVLAKTCQVYDRYFARPDPESIDYIVLLGNGSGDPGMVGSLQEYLAAYAVRHFHPIHNNINTQPIIFFGKSIPNSAQGFGMLVLQRNSLRETVKTGTLGAE